MAEPPISEVENRVESRFGVLPNFFRLAPETPRSLRNSGGSQKPPIWTILSLLFLRSVCLSTCRVFAPSATALAVTLVSWWDLAAPPAIRPQLRRRFRML